MSDGIGKDAESAPSAPPVDRDALTLIVGDDPEIHARLTKRYLEDTANLVEDLSAAYVVEAYEDYVSIAHKLKSSSRTFGANALADLCQEMETAGKSGDAEHIRTLHPKLVPAFKVVREYLASDQ